MKQRRTKFFIVVSPVASKFAKALQAALQPLVVEQVLRTNKNINGRSQFVVTPRSLNKIQQFQRFKEHNVSSPEFETSSSGVSNSSKQVWFARTLINSTNGRGIVEFDKREQHDIPDAPLYTEYIPKKAEYRFHVFGGKVIDIQQKKKKQGFDEDKRNTRIRNVNNGYVYCRDGVCPPDGAADLAVRAVDACGYQYGAVDVIYNEKRNCSYVLEVNSRPGVINATCDSYANAIIDYYRLTRK